MDLSVGLDMEILNCGPADGGGSNDFMSLRIASIFIIFAGSSFGAMFPVLARRSSWLNVPRGVFDFAKYFGSGVILATSFIHLLAPALEALGSPCLSPAWSEYPYALALALLSIFLIFVIELVAFRWGTEKLKRLGLKHDPHGHNVGSHTAHGPEASSSPAASTIEASEIGDIEKSRDQHHHAHVEEAHDSTAAAQVVGVAILEFGVILHSILIGLTLAVDPDFKVLFVVLVFHQTFEGLGIGSRLAYMKLPQRWHWVPLAAAILYGCTTPLGITVGLGIRNTYNPGSTTASIVSGCLDSISAGILIYTGLVELLAHEFLFNKEMINASNGRLAYALGCMMLGCGVMALLGKWA